MTIAQHGRDILLSIVAGFVIALGIITVSGERKAPKTSKTSKSEEKKVKDSEKSKENAEEASSEVSDQLKKSPKLKKFFGVENDNSIEEEVKKMEEVSKVLPEKYEPEEDISEHFEETILPIISIVIYTVAGAIAIYLGNLATKGLFFQVLVGFFPNEAKTLKLI